MDSKEYSKEYRRKNSAKLKCDRSRDYMKGRKTGQSQAYSAVKKAVRNGILPRLSEVVVTCSDCGLRRATQYEHRDYSKPLDVDPICVSCNRKRGKAKRDYIDLF